MLIGLSSCNEEDKLDILPPIISQLEPASGFAGSEVTIYGTNFRTSASDNKVSFNGTEAQVIAATGISLTTIVPVGASTGNVTVTTNNQTSAGLEYTVKIPIIPNITSLDPLSGEIGDQVTINGTDFSTTPDENKVSFNGITAIVTASTATTITTSVPAGASTGEVTVTRDGESNGVLFIVTTPVYTLEVSINESLDDVEENIERGMITDPGSSDLELGEFDTSGDPDNGLQRIGLRYNGITIPAGATIQKATIQFMSESDGAEECQMTIYGENAGNSAPFDPLASMAVGGRSKTTANVIWNIPPWAQDEIEEAQISVDLASIIQEIVDRADWASGNSLSFILEPTSISATATSSSQGREAATFDGNYAPKLIIIYSE